MTEPQPASQPAREVATVGELGDGHIGWLICVDEPQTWLRHRDFVLAGIRTWTYEGRTTVGLLDPSDARPGIVGTERPYAPDTPCVLLRQVRKPRRRRVAT